ncbi:TetR/AcrR family transcriptional regulator [Paenibacillus aestuarii]|uniref:TetR/AcrR family transcriptional regulator n=1 Tax=Paenibacillus aestuarii TaxID=516965 RepID=A0ABW0K370_9BACL|nr:TetR/AcrR family transcriptional regulator [Paenibacillus aestuarii]
MIEPGKKTDRRVLRSRQALREALLALMAQKPFTSISITEIVEMANYNRGTFYANYAGKEDLLNDIFAGLIQQLIRSFRAPYEKVEVFRIHELAANSVMIFDHFFQNAAVYSVLLKSKVLPDLREQMFAALKQLSQDELVPPDRDHGIDTDLLAIYSIHALLGLVFHWVESGFAHSPAYMQEQLIKLIHWRPTEVRTARAQAKG